MQGYDSVAIKADVELGGTDQRFNLLAGRTMQEKLGMCPQDILMNPLIEGLDGRKMSSSWGNTIPLTATPSDMYGKVMSMADAQIGIYLELCTRVPMEEVEQIRKGLAENTIHPKEAKMRLAREIVELYHSKEEATQAENNFTATFSEGAVPKDIPEIAIVVGTPLHEALVPKTVSSKTDLRRLIKDGAVSEVVGEAFTDINTPIMKETTLRIGKHRFVKVTTV